MGKVKKEKQSADDSVMDVSIKEEDTYDEKLKNCNVIAQPMAPKKLTKKCLKLIKKGEWSKHNHGSILHIFHIKQIFTIICIILASKQKTFLRNGLKDVQSRLKKGEKG